MEDFWFRTLYYDLLDEKQLSTHEVLWKWQPHTKAELESLKKYGEEAAVYWKLSDENTGNQIFPYEDSWSLYALSRISDILLLPFQQGDYDGASWYPDITLSQRTDYWLSLNMVPISRTQFHPFYHEIVEVEQTSDPSAPITILRELWPGFLLGNMMFCRSGVSVSGGTDYIIKEIAERSTLYFAFRRKNRPHNDLSHGWGSNSQWRTIFRRDYAINGTHYYNVDGEFDVLERAPKTGPGKQYEPTRNELSVGERIELLTNRCFVHTSKAHNDLWPYDDFYIEK